MGLSGLVFIIGRENVCHFSFFIFSSPTYLKGEKRRDATSGPSKGKQGWGIILKVNVKMHILDKLLAQLSTLSEVSSHYF